MNDRLAPPTQARAFGRSGLNRTQSPLRARVIPYASIMLASLLPFWLLADMMPLSPPFGYLAFLAWRLMRPGLMPLWVGVPLGLFDDLFSGQLLGSAVFLWSMTMIIAELMDTRFPWRGFWQDWFTAGLFIIVYLITSMVASGATLTPQMSVMIIPQILISIIVYPMVARIVAWLDRFRLSRARRIR